MEILVVPLVVEFCTFVQYIVSFLDSSGCDNILEKLFISIKHRRMCVCVCVCVWIIRCIRLGRLVFVVIHSVFLSDLVQNTRRVRTIHCCCCCCVCNSLHPIEPSCAINPVSCFVFVFVIPSRPSRPGV